MNLHVTGLVRILPSSETVLALCLVLLLLAAGCGAVTSGSEVERLRPVVLAELPHDTAAFTQGLEVAGPVLYEGTGLAGRSELRELDATTGAVRCAVPLPDDLFGEGITVVGDRIWQLTWRDGVALEWDRAELTLRRRVRLDGEGWGLCHDGSRLVRSDGSARLFFHDPITFAARGQLDVRLNGRPVTGLNELECTDGEVWANVWPTERIVRIDPTDGRVTAVVEAGELRDAVRGADVDVLNGIAAVGEGEYLLTGKNWPITFRVRFATMS